MMKNVFACAAVLALLALSPIAARAKDDETPLAKEMSAMQDNIKALKKIVANAAENPKSLELLEKIQHSVVACKSMTPAEAKKVAEKDRAKWLADYRKDMAAVLEHMCKIEVALLDGNNAKAEELFKHIKELEDDGHDKFTGE